MDKTLECVGKLFSGVKKTPQYFTEARALHVYWLWEEKEIYVCLAYAYLYVGELQTTWMEHFYSQP